MRKLIEQYRFELMQYRWGRRLLGGTFFLINPMGIYMRSFWVDKLDEYDRVLKTENYDRKKRV